MIIISIITNDHYMLLLHSNSNSNMICLYNIYIYIYIASGPRRQSRARADPESPMEDSHAYFNIELLYCCLCCS